MIYSVDEIISDEDFLRPLSERVTVDEEDRLCLDSGNYEWWIDLERVKTPEQLIGLCLHIAGKSWSDKEMLIAIMETVSQKKGWKRRL